MLDQGWTSAIASSLSAFEQNRSRLNDNLDETPDWMIDVGYLDEETAGGLCVNPCSSVLRANLEAGAG